MNYTQAYKTPYLKDQNGRAIGTDLKINSAVSMHQLIYLSPVRVMGGNLGFTVIAVSRTGNLGALLLVSYLGGAKP